MHTAAEEEGAKLKKTIQKMFESAEVIFNQAGPALGTHAGPGALGVMILPKKAASLEFWK